MNERKLRHCFSLENNVRNADAIEHEKGGAEMCS